MVEKMVEKRKRNKTSIYMHENDLCYICLETCKKPGTLDCGCDYSVHKKCFEKWYRINKTCIICHEKCNSIKKHGTVILKSNIPNINQNGYEGLFFLFYFILFLRMVSFLNEGTRKNKLTLEN